MRTFAEIYKLLTDKNGNERSLRELITIFDNEGSWIGTRQQLLELRSIQHEITGIRPGECPGCNIEVMKNMIRWVTKYESDNPPTELRTMSGDVTKPNIKKPRKQRGF